MSQPPSCFFYPATHPSIGDYVVADIVEYTEFGVKCHLPEYKSLEAFVSVTEISRRRINIISSVLKEGKSYVMKVTNISRDGRFVDLSRKSVDADSDSDAMNRFKHARKLFNMLWSSVKLDPHSFHQFTQIIQTYTSSPHTIINEFANLPPGFENVYTEHVKTYKKFSTRVEVTSFQGGVEVIRSVCRRGMDKLKELVSESDIVTMKLIKSPVYLITIESYLLKPNQVKSIFENMIDEMKSVSISPDQDVKHDGAVLCDKSLQDALDDMDEDLDHSEQCSSDDDDDES